MLSPKPAVSTPFSLSSSQCGGGHPTSWGISYPYPLPFVITTTAERWAMAGLLSLPTELLTHILDLGGHSTIVACQQTCRRMDDLTKGCMALQYTVSLGAAGLVDNTPVNMNLAERVQLLAAHETAWKETPWFPVEGYDGILGLAASSGNLLVFFHLWNDSVRFGRNLAFQRLPSIYQDVVGFSARMDPDVHLKMNEFAIDSSQDLLIYAHGSSLVMRELGTNKPHPASRAGVLSLRLNELPIPNTTRIYGDLAACMTTSIDEGCIRFRIFNWMTGALITDSVRADNFSTLRYEFLDADHVFYSSSEASTNYPNLVVENVHSSHRTIFALDFPDVVPGTTASCHFSIPQNSMPHIRSSGDSTAYFSADLSDRLIVLNIMNYDWGSLSYRKQQQTLHISTKALLSFVRLHPSGESVPWGVWAPGSVRVVPRRKAAYETVTGLHSLCGMRALNDQIVYDRQSRPVICVYDYHRGRIGNALSAQPAKDVSSGAGMWAKMRRSPSTTTRPEPTPSPSVATSYVLPGGEKEMPCLVKEISIPAGLLNGNLMCVLCEHVVVLFELSDKRLGAPIKSVFCHAI